MIMNRLSRRWIMFTLTCFFIAFLVFMPLRFALGLAMPDKSTVNAKSVQGTIWSGSITDLKAGSLSFGDMRAGLAFLPLLTGRMDYRMSIDGLPANQGFTGTIGNGWGGFQANQITGTANYVSGGDMLPLSGIEFQNFSVRFAGSGCRNASGSVRLILKTGAIPGINIDSGFLGSAKCRGGKLFLPLVSGSAMERVDITIDAKGEYALSLTLNNADPNAAAMLSLAGFQPISGGYTRAFSGRF